MIITSVKNFQNKTDFSLFVLKISDYWYFEVHWKIDNNSFCSFQPIAVFFYRNQLFGLVSKLIDWFLCEMQLWTEIGWHEDKI